MVYRNLILSYCLVESLLKAMGKGNSISHQMEHLLATGNLLSRTGLGLQQVKQW